MDKERELKFVCDIANRLNWEVATITPRESPDFQLLLQSGNVVGLEVEEMIDEGAAAGRASIDRLRNALRDRMEQIGLSVTVLLSFYWGAAELVASGAKRQEHVDALLKLILAASPLPAGKTTFTESQLEDVGAPFVQRMHVVPGAKPHVGFAHHRPGPGDAFLVEKIRRKEELLERYRSNLPDAALQWLLLVAGAHHAASFDSEIAQEAEIATRFDRIFFVDMFDDKAFELTTTRKAAP